MFQFRRILSVLALSSAACVFLGPVAQTAFAQTASEQTASEQTAAPQDTAEANAVAEPQTTQQRAEVLREAQARVMARRRIREQQIIQDTYSHKYEIYAGSGYLRFKPGPNLQHNTNVAWNVGLTDWVRGRLGATVDFRGYYGTAVTNSFEYQVFLPSISQYTFMAGPQYRFYQGLHWAWNAQILAGVGHSNFGTGTNGFGASNVGLYPDGNKFALSVGVPVEYNLGPALALRLMPDYLMTTYGGQTQQNLGFTGSMVFRFGRK